MAGCTPAPRALEQPEPNWLSNPWLKSCGDLRFFERGVLQIARDEFAVLTAPQALARLEASPWVELTAEEAQNLLGRPLGGTGGRIVLLRGVAVTDRIDNFIVAWRDGEVLVDHIDRIVGTPKPVRQRAIVARLPALPKDAFVEVGIAD